MSAYIAAIIALLSIGYVAWMWFTTPPSEDNRPWPPSEKERMSWIDDDLTTKD